MMNKEKIKKIMLATMTILLTFLFLHCSANILERKESKIKYTEFFMHDNNCDVLFLGNSHIFCNIYPNELWNDFGITAYDYCIPSAFLPVSYWLLKNLLKYKKPKLVVLDLYHLRQEAKVKRIGAVHSGIDVLPLNKLKYNMIMDIFDSEDSLIKLQFIFPFTTYHNRWNKLKKADFKYMPSIEKGEEKRVKVYKRKGQKVIDDVLEDNIGIKYMKKIISECKNKGIDVLLIYMPCDPTIDMQKEANTGYLISEKFNIQYINLLYSNLISFETDLNDSQHLNVSGGMKITNYIGKYIQSNYNIKDHRNDIEFQYMNDDYKKYIKLKINKFKNAETIKIYLLLASDKHFNYKIYISDKKILNDKLICDLLVNVGIDVEKLINDNVNVVEIDNVNNEVKYTYMDNVKDENYKISFEVLDQKNKKILNKKFYNK